MPATKQDDPRKDEFIALLQARASGLVTEDEAKARLKVIYPEWFEGKEGAAA